MGLASIFSWVLRTSMIATVLAGLILLIKAIFGKRLGVRWQYAIWWILILRLLLPVTLPSSLSIFSLFNTAASNIQIGSGPTLYEFGASVNALIEPVNLALSATINQQESKQNTVMNTVQVRTPAQSALRLIYYVWLAGVVLLALFALLFNIRFWLKIKKQRQVTAPVFTRLFWECRFKLRISRDIPIIQTDAVRSPALYGFIRPCLLMPPEIEQILDQDELRCVFIHELAHWKRKDILLNWILGFLQILHWFNPLIWYSFRRIRFDREIACDTLALSVIAPEERVKYGTTIINLLRNFYKPTRTALLTGMLDSKTQVKRRITAIANYSRHPYRWSILALAVLLIAGFLFLTGDKIHQRYDWTNTKAFKRVDRVNYPFVNDPEIIGKWQAVDFVPQIDLFQPDRQNYDDLYLKTVYFTSHGRMPFCSITWTKGLILDKRYKTASKYLIKKIEGQTYMFREWKSGDYTFRGMTPQYYVLRQIDNHDYKPEEMPRKVDKIDLPFVNDPELIGKWKVVDIIEQLFRFDPKRPFKPNFYKVEDIQFYKNGITSNPQVIWTKGNIIDRKQKASSKYMFITINHVRYLFYERKSDAYTFLGMDPMYYVLTKK